MLSLLLPYKRNFMAKKLLIVGSMNVDMVVKAPRLPRSGETLLGGVFNQNYGGKGANSALAANILSPNVSFCAGVGNDNLGKEYLEYLKQKKLDISLLKIVEGAHTGVAVIMVAKEGENIITVAPGANLELLPEDLEKIDFKEFSYVAFQLENKIETIEKGLSLAKAAGCQTILNPSPARLLSDDILKNVDFLIPNEIEILQLMRGYTHIEKAADALLSKGVKNIIITLGARGCMLINSKTKERTPAHSVRPIDTVGAGDCFTGSFMAGLSIYNGDIKKAILIANAAAGLLVTKMGAQSHSKAQDVLKMIR